MSCLLSLICFAIYWFTSKPELMIAAGLFAIAAEIYSANNHKKKEEETDEKA